METLVATIIIVVIFAVASMVLNTLFLNSFKSNTNEIENYLNELEYTIHTNDEKINIKTLTYQDWEITILEKDSLKIMYYNIIAKNNKTTKELKRVIIKNE